MAGGNIERHRMTRFQAALLIVAVGIVLASVVLLVSMFIGEGVSSLSKSLIPQPSIGKVRVMR